MFLLFTVGEPEFLLTKMSPLVYSIMAILGFVVIGKGLYNNDSIKTIIGKVLIISVISFMAYKPVIMKNLGETIINFVTDFTGYFKREIYSP